MTTTYDVTFERIGRGCKGVTERFTVNAGADGLAEAIYGYARRHLSSSGYVVGLDMEEGKGSIEFGRFGAFTFEEARNPEDSKIKPGEMEIS